MGAPSRADASWSWSVRCRFGSHRGPSRPSWCAARTAPTIFASVYTSISRLEHPVDEVLIVDNGLDPETTGALAKEFSTATSMSRCRASTGHGRPDGRGSVRRRVVVHRRRRRGAPVLGDCVARTSTIPWSWLPVGSCCPRSSRHAGPIGASNSMRASLAASIAECSTAVSNRRRSQDRRGRERRWRCAPTSYERSAASPRSWTRACRPRAAATRTCSARVLREGFRIVYEPSALALHSRRSTAAALERVFGGYGTALWSWAIRALVQDHDPVTAAKVTAFGDRLLRRARWPAR